MKIKFLTGVLKNVKNTKSKGNYEEVVIQDVAIQKQPLLTF